MSLIRASYTPDRALCSLVNRYHAEGDFFMISCHIAAEAGTPDYQYRLINVPGEMRTLAHDIKTYNNSVSAGVKDFLGELVTDVTQLTEDSANSAKKNLEYLGKTDSSAWRKNFQLWAQSIEVLEQLAQAHANGMRTGVLEKSFDDNGNPKLKLTGLFTTDKELAQQLMSELEIEITKESGNSRAER